MVAKVPTITVLCKKLKISQAHISSEKFDSGARASAHTCKQEDLWGKALLSCGLKALYGFLRTQRNKLGLSRSPTMLNILLV